MGMRHFSGKRLLTKLVAILALGLCASALPAYKYVYSVLRESDRYGAELGGARILQGLAILSHFTLSGSASGDASAASAKRAISDAKASISAGCSQILRTSSYLKQASPEKHSNISTIYTQESLDAFDSSRNKASILLDMSDGALVAGGLYSDPATDRYLLVKICGTYFPKIYSGLFRLQVETSIDGDKSQLSIIRDELLDDIENLSAALRTLSSNFESAKSIRASSEKILKTGTALTDSIFSEEFNPDEIAKKMSVFETLCAQTWIYCSGVLVDSLSGALHNAHLQLAYFLAEYALFIIFLSSAAMIIALGVRKAAARTALLARSCISGSAEDAKVDYYASAALFGREFKTIDSYILDALEMRERLLDISKKLSIMCVSSRNEISAAVSLNSKILEYADSALEELEKNVSGPELYGGALKASRRISELVSELSEGLPQKEVVAGDFSKIISAQSQAVQSADESADSAIESVGSLGRLAGEIAAIADRANLISLNMSIEVGKSGNAGSGLSILAEQIKLLAKRTGVVVMDMEKAAGDCGNCLNAVKAKISALSAPLSHFRREADKMLESISSIENSVTSLSYSADNIEGLAGSSEMGTLSLRLKDARGAVAKAEKALAELSRISQNATPLLGEISKEISAFK